MSKQELVDALRNNKNLLPRDVLGVDGDIYKLAKDLKDIYSEYYQEIEHEELFRSNFVHTMSYTYMVQFNDTKHSIEAVRNKKQLYSKNFINSVLALPAVG